MVINDGVEIPSEIMFKTVLILDLLAIYYQDFMQFLNIRIIYHVVIKEEGNNCDMQYTKFGLSQNTTH